VANDWRVTVTLGDTSHVARVARSLHEHEAEEDLRRQLGGRVAVSADGPRLFLYAGTEDAARTADQVVGQVLARHELSAQSVTLQRWHPVEEEWEDASVALPQTPQQRQAEHERLEQEETQQSLATGQALWEVRAELPSHREAVALARRLEAQGRPVIRRWTLLILGANDQDDANELARAVQAEAPADATVSAQEVGPVVAFVQVGPLAFRES
jgi:hypothetical protein